MTLLLGLLIVLVVANLLMLGVVMKASRVSTPVCGACNAPLAPTTDRTCESCGANLVERGIVAGAVMRPLSRVGLIALMGIVVLSLSPLLATVANEWIRSIEQNGPWINARTAVFNNSRDDVPAVHVTVHERFAGPFLTTAVRESVEVSIELDDDSMPALLLGGENVAMVSSQQAVRRWFSIAGAGVDEASIDGVVEHLSAVSASSQGSGVGAVRPAATIHETSRVPVEPLVDVGIWAAAGAVLVIMLVVGVWVVLARTKRSLERAS